MNVLRQAQDGGIFVSTTTLRLSREALAEIQPCIIRHVELKKWDITIVPEPVLF